MIAMTLSFCSKKFLGKVVKFHLQLSGIYTTGIHVDHDIYMYCQRFVLKCFTAFLEISKKFDTRKEWQHDNLQEV